MRPQTRQQIFDAHPRARADGPGVAVHGVASRWPVWVSLRWDSVASGALRRDGFVDDEHRKSSAKGRQARGGSVM